MQNKNRMTVAECAELMHVSQQFVRVGLQQGKLPFGYAIKQKGRWCYFISPAKFQEATGIVVG